MLLSKVIYNEKLIDPILIKLILFQNNTIINRRQKCYHMVIKLHQRIQMKTVENRKAKSNLLLLLISKLIHKIVFRSKNLRYLVMDCSKSKKRSQKHHIRKHNQIRILKIRHILCRQQDHNKLQL